MKKSRIFTAVPVLIFLFSLILRGETGSSDTSGNTIFYYGAYASYNRNYHFSNFQKIPGYPNCCDNFEYGTGDAFSLGMLVNFELINSVSLDLRLGFSKLGGELRKTQYDGNTIVQNTVTGDDIRGIETEYIINSRLTALAFEPALNFTFFSKLTSILGFSFDYMSDKKFDQYEKIISPDNVVFKSDGRKIRNDYYNQDIPDASSFLISGLMGAEYRLDIGSGSYLLPYIRYYVPFTDVSNLEWKVASMQIGLAVRLPFVLYPEKPLLNDTIYRRDTTVIALAGLDAERVKFGGSDTLKKTETLSNAIIKHTIITERYQRQIPKDVRLEASLHVTGIRSDGSKEDNPTLVIEETETEEGFPLLPHIFFGNGESNPVNSGLHILSKSETGAFTPDSLPWNTLDIYKELLNIVAYRLKQKKEAKLTITGMNDNSGLESGNLELSASRAEAVKKYFTDVWGIEESRISVKRQNLPSMPSNNSIEDGRIENRRAEISSSDKDILKPVTIRQYIRTSNPPLIEILPEISSENGIQLWALEIKQQDKLLRDYAGTDIPGKIMWNVEDAPVPLLEVPVNIELSVKDILNVKKSISHTLTIRQMTVRKKRVELMNDRFIERYSLILFDFDKADINAEQKEILENIRERITPESHVTIAAFTDRTGEREYNKSLAERRAKEVQKILRVNPQNLTINAAGSDILLYDNNLPQGRSYSRTVQIIIETPVE